MPATMASKKSDTEPSRASVALAYSNFHLHRRLCAEPKKGNDARPKSLTPR